MHIKKYQHTREIGKQAINAAYSRLELCSYTSPDLKKLMNTYVCQEFNL